MPEFVRRIQAVPLGKWTVTASGGPNRSVGRRHLRGQLSHLTDNIRRSNSHIERRSEEALQAE